MSTLLEQAIIDAEALKEVALKNAETRILEKYSTEVKGMLNSLLEQEEEEDPFGDLGGEEGGDELGGDLGGGMDMGGEEAPPEDEPVVKDMPDAFADGEKLCPCPDEDEEIEIDFNDLAKQLQDEEPGEEEMIDREEEFGLGGGEEEEEEEGMGALMESFEELIAQALSEEVTFDGDVSPSGYGGATTEEIEEAEMFATAKALANADEKDTKEVKDATVEEIVTGTKESEEKEAEFERQKAHLTERIAYFRAETEDQLDEIKALTRNNKALNKRISKLQEQVLKVNLANAKLLYTNKAMGNASLNERQKIKIVESISLASSVDEAKTIYETLQSTVSSATTRRAPNSLSEAVNRGRTPTLFAGRRKEEPEADLASDRWRVLAGIGKK